MTKIWIFVLTMLFSSCTFADVQYKYDADTVENIQSIYWLTKAEDSAIVYARFEGFISLRNLIDQTILTGNISEDALVNPDSADKLLLMMPEQESILEVLITDNYLIFNGLNYRLDSNLINKLKAMNDYRIEKGDLISSGTLSMARKKFGRHL